MQRLRVLKPLELTSRSMPKQPSFVKRGQDLTVLPSTGARLWGLALMIAGCSGSQAEYQHCEFIDYADGGKREKDTIESLELCV